MKTKYSLLARMEKVSFMPRTAFFQVKSVWYSGGHEVDSRAYQNAVTQRNGSLQYIMPRPLLFTYFHFVIY